MTVLVTLAGQAKFAAAAADAGSPLALTHIALGNGGGAPIVPYETMTSLVSEVYRTGLQAATVDPDNPNWIVCSAVVPSEAGPFTIREIGLFDAQGTLIAVGSYPETAKLVAAQGVSTSLEIELILVVSETANVTVRVDEQTFSTQVWVDANYVRKPGPFLFFSMI